MADRPGPTPDGRDEPGFDWLYGTQRKGIGSTPAERPGETSSRDPEPTQRLPTIDRPGSGARAGSNRPFQAPAPAPSRAPRENRPPAGPPPSGPTRGRSRFRPRFRPRVGWLKYVALVWLVFLVAVPLFAWQHIEKVDATPAGSRPAQQPGTTYLLVGSDSRQGLTAQQKRQFATGSAAGRRTDTMMLLHTGAGPNLLMSIPRDSIVAVPGHGATKINAAFAYGGPKLLVRTIEQDTGIRVDDYVEVGFAGFVNVVDAVGGVQICPKRTMNDRRANLHVKKGCQNVKGTVALGYARSRHGQRFGDITRAAHQREVVSAVGHKAASPWTILNPFRYARLAMAGADSLRVGTDTGMLATMRFAWAMTRVNGSNGLTCGVPISDLAVHWDPVRSKKLFGLVAKDRTADVTKSLCRANGLAGG